MKENLILFAGTRISSTIFDNTQVSLLTLFLCRVAFHIPTTPHTRQKPPGSLKQINDFFYIFQMHFGPGDHNQIESYFPVNVLFR